MIACVVMILVVMLMRVMLIIRLMESWQSGHLSQSSSFVELCNSSFRRLRSCVLNESVTWVVQNCG